MSNYTLIEDFKGLKGYLLLNGFEIDSTLYWDPEDGPFYLFKHRNNNVIKVNTDFLATVKFLNGYSKYIYGYNSLLENIPKINHINDILKNKNFEMVPRQDDTVFFNKISKQTYSPFKIYVTSDDEKITILKSVNSNGRSQPFYIYKNLYSRTYGILYANFPTITIDEFNNYVFHMVNGNITLLKKDLILIKLLDSKDFKAVYLKDLLWIDNNYMLIKDYNGIEIYSLKDLKLIT